MNRRLGYLCGAVLLLLLFWGRVLVNVRDQSPTMDEPFHLVRGAAYWLTGDLRLQYEHPPLAHALGGVLLALDPEVPSPADLFGWDRAYGIDVAQHFLGEPGRPLDRMVFLGRWAIPALGLLLAALVSRWAGELFGREAGLAALFLCTFEPNILAHSSLMTTDLAVTCATCGACYGFSRWLGRPTRARLLLAGLTLGLALGAKLSALILLPVLGLALLWHVWRSRASMWSFLAGFAAILVLGLLVLWALYRFETGVWATAGTWMPMPTYLDNLQRLWQHQTSGQPAFFLGQVSDEGWWHYFPVLFLIKTPVPLLILLIVAVVTACRTRRVVWPPVMIVSPALYFAVSIVSRINIGYRHILPVIPFAVIGVASVFRPPRRSRAPFIVHCPLVHCSLFIGSLLIVLWMALSSLWIHPYYLAYFNELVGGPDQGYRYAVDSNLDWGQDLKRLRAYLDEQGIGRVRLSYFGRVEPDWYTIEHDPLSDPLHSSDIPFSPLNPEPGVYAISASSLQLMEDPDFFDWFRRRQPTAKVGHSIFVYDVPDHPERWAAVCYAPIPALESDQAREALGSPDLRLTYFDCRSSWVYPAGAAPGWYVIPELTEGLTVTPAYLDDSQISFHRRRTSQHLGLTVYQGEGAGSGPARLTTLEGADVAVQFGDVARFLGYELERGESVTLRTYWEVLDPPDYPLSVMAHLVDGQGAVVAVADGLGFPVTGWQAGDVFAQTHPVTLPSGGDLTYTFNVGLYRLDTMEHIPPQGFETDHLVLEPFGE